MELGQLVDDLDVGIAALLRHLVPEADAVIVHPDTQADLARRRAGLEQHEQLVEAIADPAALAPRLLPGAVAAAALGTHDAQARIESRVIGKAHPEPRLADYPFPAVADAVARYPVVVDIDGERDAGVWRLNLQRHCRGREQRKQ